MDWSPSTAFQVQATLFASLVECSQHRHRKLDGIVCWYFNHVMESLPLMLQVAPGRAHPVRLCPFCAFLGYEHDHHISSPRSHLVWRSLLPLHVVEEVASPTFPYQTPAACILRYAPHPGCTHFLDKRRQKPYACGLPRGSSGSNVGTTHHPVTSMS